MQVTTDRIAEHDFFIFMQASHHVLARYAEQLRASVLVNDRDAMQQLWRRLEAKLLAHMEAEERYVLPDFARAVPDEAFALIREHGAIRERMLELGITLELHHLRLERFDEFLSLLLDHAKREEALMYRWASTMLERKLATAAQRHIDFMDRPARR